MVDSRCLLEHDRIAFIARAHSWSPPALRGGRQIMQKIMMRTARRGRQIRASCLAHACCALLKILVVGTERDRSHRPALVQRRSHTPLAAPPTSVAPTLFVNARFRARAWSLTHSHRQRPDHASSRLCSSATSL